MLCRSARACGSPLRAGLHDLSGDVLKQDLSWTFETQALSFTSLPQLTAGDDEATPAPVGLLPKLQVTTNAAVDVASLAARAEFDGTDGSTIGVTAVLEATPSPSPGDNAQELYDPSLNDWVYDLRPARELRRATTYRLAIAPGVEPLYGNLATTESFPRRRAHLRCADNSSDARSEPERRRPLYRRGSGDRVQQSARSGLDRKCGDDFAGAGRV